MKRDEGGSISVAEFAARVGLPVPTVLRNYQRRRFLGWKEKREKMPRLPAWQLEGGDILPGMTRVLGILNKSEQLDDFGRIGFFLCSFGIINGRRPLDCLRSRQVDEAILAAKAYVQ